MRNKAGWCAYARHYAGENFRLFVFAIPVIALLTVIAYILSDRRDMGGSYVQERNGREHGLVNLKNPLALAWRLQRGMLFVWVAAYAVMGLVIASLMPAINKILEGTAFLPQLSAIMAAPATRFSRYWPIS